MNIALSLVALLAVVIGVSGLCRRFQLSAPLVLIAVGVLGSLLPFLPEVRITEEIVLVGLLPPLLYAAALQTSLVDFNANRRPILLLSVGLVAFTALGVGVAMHAVLPGLSWPAAFAIGAVVAPPDAVAATAMARRFGLPRRIVTILEGESLVNDATALVALRTAIGAATVAVGVVEVGVEFLLAAGGGLLVGLLTFAVVGWVRKRVKDPVIDTSVSFVTPFAAYVAAEELHVSGVLAVVVAGLLLGHSAPVLQTASSRIAERLNWRTISFLLENTVFLLIGLQARWIFAGVADSGVSAGRVVLVCVTALLVTMLLRPIWIFAVRALLLRPTKGETSTPVPSWKSTTIVSWAGMRGVVTLAAAFAIPESFEHREVLLLAAFTVTAGTLFVQGLSMPWLIRRLGVTGPDPREDALAVAVLFDKAAVAGVAVLEKNADEDDPYDTLAAVRRRSEQRDHAAWELLGPDAETPSAAYARLRLEMLQAERARVLEVRSSGNLPHEVVAEVLAALDVEESMLVDADERRTLRRRDEEPPLLTAGFRPMTCEHLDAARDDTRPNVEGACEDCLVEGTRWVHLRLCLECGHMGCCDSSPRRHATAHFHDVGHPVMRSGEPGEAWRWFFVDNRLG